MKPFKDTYVMYQLLEFIDESSIICLCKASKKLNEICKQYIEMEDDKRFGIILSQSKYYNSYLLLGYCQYNNVIKIRKIIKIKNLFWDWGLEGACNGGHIDIVKLMIEKDAKDWNSGLEGACQNNHIDIVTLMIEKGAHICWYCRRSIEEHLKKK